MYSYERTYRTGRAVASILEIVGWIIVFIGVITALAGLASGGFFGMASRNFGSGDTPFILRIVAMLPGVVTAALGLFFILQCQQAKATIDNAEMARDMLGLAKAGGFSPSSGSETQGKEASGRSSTASIEKARPLMFDQNGMAPYRGRMIRRDGDKFYVGSVALDSIDEAKTHIEKGL